MVLASTISETFTLAIPPALTVTVVCWVMQSCPSYLAPEFAKISGITNLPFLCNSSVADVESGPLVRSSYHSEKHVIPNYGRDQWLAQKQA